MSLKKQIIRHEDGTPYMIRRAINTPLFGIKLHHILLSDEESFQKEECSPATTTRSGYGAGSILWRPAPWVHRLILPEGKTAWTLVLTGPKKREWGFHTICGWIPWTDYWQRKREGC